MSAGEEACNNSSRFKLLGGDFPPTFHVAVKMLQQIEKRRQLLHN